MQPPPSMPRVVRTLLVLLAACLVPMAAALLLDRGVLSRRWWDNWGYSGVILGVAALVLARALLHRQARTGWLLIGSLSYLQDLPVDDLKLDRSFVMRSVDDPRSAAIVRSTVGLAHALDMRIIAEGVENEAVLDQLTAIGCDLAQGYYIARPMHADQLTAWLTADPAVAAVTT